MCAWQFGTTSTVSTPNGSAKHNIQIPSGDKYLVQMLWSGAGRGNCEMSCTTTRPSTTCSSSTLIL